MYLVSINFLFYQYREKKHLQSWSHSLCTGEDGGRGGGIISSGHLQLTRSVCDRFHQWNVASRLPLLLSDENETNDDTNNH